MTFKDNLKGGWFKVKIFSWYLITEPFRQINALWYHVGNALNKTIYWVYYLLIITIIAFLFGKRYVAGFLLVALLGLILTWEWQSGYFMNRYRQKERMRIKKVLDDKEYRAMKGWREDKNGKRTVVDDRGDSVSILPPDSAGDLHHSSRDPEVVKEAKR